MLSILTLRPFPDLALLREGQGGWGCLNKSSTKKQLQCCEEWDLSVICCLKPRRLQVWGRLEFWACSAVWEKQWEGKHHPLWGNYWNYQRPAPVPANDNPTPHHSLSPCNWYNQSHSLVVSHLQCVKMNLKQTSSSLPLPVRYYLHTGAPPLLAVALNRLIEIMFKDLMYKSTRITYKIKQIFFCYLL